MTLQEAITHIDQGAEVHREKWALENNNCRRMRRPCDSDVEYIPNMNLEGVFIEDCDRRNCDCKIMICQLTEDDKNASDWQVITH